MNPILLFEVTNQMVTRKDSFYVVAKSKSYLSAKFDFKTTEWTGDIFAIFGSVNGIYQIKLDAEKKCTVPWEVLKSCGKVYVSAWCGNLVTANKALFTVYESGYKDADTPSEPTKTIYHQILDQMDALASGKVDKVTGKGLSTNDYTNTAKAKVDAIPSNPKYTDTVYDDTALKNRVQTIEGKEASWDAKSDFSGSYNDLANKPNLFSGAYDDLTGKPDLFSGDYEDLTNKPTIPEAYDDTEVREDVTRIKGSLSNKLTEPPTGLEVGKYFRIASIDADGHAVLEACDAPQGVDVQIDGTSITADGVANIPIATSSTLGTIKVSSSFGTDIQNGVVTTVSASEAQINGRAQYYTPIVPKTLDYAVKSAICDGKGAEWTDAEKASARERMGASSEWKLIADVTLEEATYMFSAEDFDYTNAKFLIIFPVLTESYKLGISYISFFNKNILTNRVCTRCYYTEAKSDIYAQDSSACCSSVFERNVNNIIVKDAISFYNKVYIVSNSRIGFYNIMNNKYSDGINLNKFVFETTLNPIPIGTKIILWGK